MQLLLIKTLIAGVGIALISGPLSCLLAWRRMAYLGDSISHAALLGVAFGIIFNLNPLLGTLISSLLFAASYYYFEKYNNDSILATLSYFALAVAIILISKSPINIDLSSYLFGDILLLSATDLVIVYVISLVFLLWLKLRLNFLLASTIYPDFAKLNKMSNGNFEIVFVIAIFVTISFKFFGALLITSMLINPALSARSFSQTPEEMIKYASLIAVITAIIGIVAGWCFDLPISPAIIVSGVTIFVLIHIFKK